MIFRNLTKNYTTIPNELIIDKELSNGAFRLYCYLASKPETWEANNKDIMTQLRIGSKDTMAKYWKELIEGGWLEKAKEQNIQGKFTGKTILTLYNERKQKKQKDKSIPDSKKIQYPKNKDIVENATHSNTEYISNTEYKSNKEKEKRKKEKENSLRSNTPYENSETKSEDKQIDNISSIEKENKPLKENENLKDTNSNSNKNNKLKLLVDWYFKVLKMINPNYNEKQIQNNRIVVENTFRSLNDFKGYSYERIGKLIDNIRKSDNKYFKQKLMNIRSFEKIIDEAEMCFLENSNETNNIEGLL